MQPIYALHKDRQGTVLGASAFSYDYELQSWLRSLDVRAGDRIEFDEAAKREPEPVETSAFLAETPAPPPTEKPILADDPF